MKLAVILLLGLAALAVAGSLYVRLAPLPMAGPGDRAPRFPQFEGDPGGFGTTLRTEDPDAAARLDAVIRATPRTRLLEGSLAEGHLRYVTRSLIWGFPDITDVLLRPGEIHIHGHLVYGRSDLGVNRRRIEGWLAAVGL